MDINEFQGLIVKYRQGKCSSSEQLLIDRWYRQYHENEPNLLAEEIEAAQKEVEQRLPPPVFTKKIGATSPTMGIAAAIIFLCFFSFLYSKKTQENKEQMDISKILPGSNKATLILSSGQVYDLNDTVFGEIMIEPGLQLIKTPGGQLEFTSIPPQASFPSLQQNSSPGLINQKLKPLQESLHLNTLTTPTGGEFRIGLPDGTRVIVNAGSTLRFPSSFKDMQERRVHLIGEAYFEVPTVKSIVGVKKRAQRIPFIVQTHTQKVRVMGTKFNINSYDYNSTIKTTLIEGLVQVSSPQDSMIITPGMSVYNTGTRINVVDYGNVEMDIAWKNGEFMFEKENLGYIMKKISRWYDIDVKYADPKIINKPFTGTISKFKTISEVLALLSETGEIKFTVKGRTIFISTN